MDLFLGLLAGTIRKPLLDKLQDYLDIKKGERRDKDFEKLYATVVTGFVRTQKHLDEAQARKYFASPVTYDGVLLYLYRFTDPEPVLREQTKAALCRWAGNYKLTGSADVTNAALVARFLNELERELRADVNKTLLPYFADIRSDIALAVERILQAIKEQPTPAPDPVPEFKIHTAKLPTTGSRLFGRAAPLEMLNAAWANENTNIVSLVAWGGVGKTALMQAWLSRLAQKKYAGARRVYGWSFYSQGAREERNISADAFFDHALRWFGYTGAPFRDQWAKGSKLAELLHAQKTLLILDGLEPLQFPPGELQGRLKDQGLLALLKQLAQYNPGLCLITTRVAVDDIEHTVGKTTERVFLENLTPAAGAGLLESLGVQGTAKALRAAAKDFGGHALALTLLGRYLAVVHGGDIRKRDLIPKLTAEEKHGGHARRVMQSYENWLAGQPELEILSLLGLFDRPAEPGALAALRTGAAIPGLTETVQDLPDKEWRYALQHLRDLRLLAAAEQARPNTLDCHPLVREHFGERLRQQHPDAWREAHSRLYDYYKSLPDIELPDTLSEMEPLFAAVAHGCLAGKHQEAEFDVYWKRIERGNEHYSTTKLGAFGADLAALANFFDPPWRQPAAGLPDEIKAVVLSWAGFGLRALGRLREAAAPMQAAKELAEREEDWKNAAKGAGNLSELFLTLGQVPQAVDFARQSVAFADRSGDAFQRESKRTTLADALHQAGELDGAEKLFRDAETLQQQRQPAYRYLYSLQGFRFCDLLLSRGQVRQVLERGSMILEIGKKDSVPLEIALGNLVLGRVYLLQAQAGTSPAPAKNVPGHPLQRGLGVGSLPKIREGHGGVTRDATTQNESLSRAAHHLDQAVAGLREAGTQHHIPRGLFARAALARVQANFAAAWDDLSEALDIAERGEMRLYLTDFHLEGCRVCLAEDKQTAAREHVEMAAKLVEETGYHRRDGEVEALRWRVANSQKHASGSK